MSSVHRQLARIDAGLDAMGDLRNLAVLRILLGPIVLLHLQDFFRNARAGVIYSDRFYLPYFDWYPEAGRSLYEPMLWAAAVAAVAMSFGLLTRLATTYSAFFVGYNLFLSKTHFAHNRAFLLILLTVVAIVPVGRYYSLDALLRRATGRAPKSSTVPLWPLWLLRFEVVVVYSASATSKLLDPDWWGGRVLQLRAIDNRQLSLDGGAPVWLMDLLADGTFQWWAAKGAVLYEFAIAAGFLHPRTRLIAIWLAIPFHLTIQVGARVQVFSWAALAALVIWVTPQAHDRDLTVPHGHWLGRLVRMLDWFGRFDLHHDDGRVVALIDRSTDAGRPVTRRGTDAIWTTLSRLPVAFVLAGPVLTVRRLRARRTARHPRNVIPH